jgi:hypothetical protein
MEIRITRKLNEDLKPSFSIETVESSEVEDEFALYANFKARYSDEEMDELDWDSVEFQGEKTANFESWLLDNRDLFHDSFDEKKVTYTFAELVVRQILDADEWFYGWPKGARYERQEFAKKISERLMKLDVAEISELRDGPITLALLVKLDTAKVRVIKEKLRAHKQKKDECK